ncbi:MAG: hypothetical protein AAGJ73_12755 [Pseudomonadota bacterium]
MVRSGRSENFDILAVRHVGGLEGVGPAFVGAGPTPQPFDYAMRPDGARHRPGREGGQI